MACAEMLAKEGGGGGTRQHQRGRMGWGDVGKRGGGERTPKAQTSTAAAHSVVLQPASYAATTSGGA